jgi:hypothetical protein
MTGGIGASNINYELEKKPLIIWIMMIGHQKSI